MTEPLTLLKSAMDMYQAQYTATDRLWGYFATVSLAFVAYTISSEKVTRIFPEAVAAIAAYVVFCVGNLLALRSSQAQLQALSAIVRERGQAANVDMSAFRPFSVDQLTNFYIAVVMAVCLSTLLLAWYRSRRRSPSKCTP